MASGSYGFLTRARPVRNRILLAACAVALVGMGFFPSASPPLRVLVPSWSACSEPHELVRWANGAVRSVAGVVEPGYCALVPAGEAPFLRARACGQVSGAAVKGTLPLASCIVTLDLTR
jgi:hypothetical protein